MGIPTIGTTVTASPTGVPSASMACDISAYAVELTSRMYMIWFPSGDHVML